MALYRLDHLVADNGTPRMVTHELYLRQCEEDSRRWRKAESLLIWLVKRAKRCNGTHSTVPTSLVNSAAKILAMRERRR